VVGLKRFDIDFIEATQVACQHLFGESPDYVHFFDNNDPASGFDCLKDERITIETTPYGIVTVVTFPEPMTGTLTLSVIG